MSSICLKQFEYDDHMDAQMVGLCNAINTLPGLSTSESCCGHGRERVRVFFQNRYYALPPVGLFILARCVDRRYWQYGNLWDIQVTMADVWDGHFLPVHYVLESHRKGRIAYAQADDLVENIRYHLNHKAFMQEYRLDEFVEIMGGVSHEQRFHQTGRFSFGGGRRREADTVLV